VLGLKVSVVQRNISLIQPFLNVGSTSVSVDRFRGSVNLEV